MQNPNVIVSGKNGQLGYEINKLSVSFPQYAFHFFDVDDLDITSETALENIFSELKPVAFINCSAYTAVDKAETEQVIAYKVNAEATGLIANLCRINNTVFFHVSTDYVFDGNGVQPYKEIDKTNPVNYYGYTKWMGEELALKNHDKSIVIRTSWVYSSHGNNFVKTMLRLMKERPELKVVNDQTGSPTYAADLAEVILQLLPKSLQKDFDQFGLYQFSNEGVITWFQFAEAIKEIAGLSTPLYPIQTADYPTPAKRPKYSVFDHTKIKTALGVELKPWKASLQKCMQLLQNQ